MEYFYHCTHQVLPEIRHQPTFFIAADEIHCFPLSRMPFRDVILIAEDNEDHAMLMHRAFKQANFLNPLQFVQDGEDAIAYLSGTGKFANRDEYPLPGLILLDLKMPRRDGFQVIQWIREQPGLSRLRVVVLTSSDETRDINRAYELGANSFLTKPVDFRDFVQLTHAIQGYWLWMSKAPESTRPAAGRKNQTSPTDC